MIHQGSIAETPADSQKKNPKKPKPEPSDSFRSEIVSLVPHNVNKWLIKKKKNKQIKKKINKKIKKERKTNKIKK